MPITYEFLDKQLQGRCKNRRRPDTRKSNSWIIRHEDRISILYYSTEIAHFFPDGTIELTPRGWESSSCTRRYLNELIGTRGGITSWKGEVIWWRAPGLTEYQGSIREGFRIPFSSGDKILPDGTVFVSDPQPEEERIKLHIKHHAKRYRPGGMSLDYSGLWIPSRDSLLTAIKSREVNLELVETVTRKWSPFSKAGLVDAGFAPKSLGTRLRREIRAFLTTTLLGSEEERKALSERLMK